MILMIPTKPVAITQLAGAPFSGSPLPWLRVSEGNEQFRLSGKKKHEKQTS